jgi:hypothetical protein
MKKVQKNAAIVCVKEIAGYSVSDRASGQGLSQGECRHRKLVPGFAAYSPQGRADPLARQRAEA